MARSVLGHRVDDIDIVESTIYYVIDDQPCAFRLGLVTCYNDLWEMTLLRDDKFYYGSGTSFDEALVNAHNDKEPI